MCRPFGVICSGAPASRPSVRGSSSWAKTSGRVAADDHGSARPRPRGHQSRSRLAPAADLANAPRDHPRRLRRRSSQWPSRHSAADETPCQSPAGRPDLRGDTSQASFRRDLQRCPYFPADFPRAAVRRERRRRRSPSVSRNAYLSSASGHHVRHEIIKTRRTCRASNKRDVGCRWLRVLILTRRC